MRISSRGVTRNAEPFVFTFEGRCVTAHPGESLAAALIASGIVDLRETRSGAHRGLFCGMGVCGECEVRIDGRSGRACLEPARAGVVVRRCPAFAAPGQQDAPVHAQAENWREISPEVLVIGAGPAGLSAARAAGAAGLDVLVVDERGKAGGQYFKQPGAGFKIDEGSLDAQYAQGLQLEEAARAAGAKFLMGATVWGAFAPNSVAVVVGGATRLLKPKRLILATGAYERAVPVPGWTLPGVMTTGAAQTLLRAYQVAPGARVLIAGNGPLNLQVAHELMRAGVHVVAIAETAAPPYAAAPSSVLAMAATAPGLLAAGLRQLLELRVRGVPLHYRHALIAAEGTTRVNRAVLAAIDSSGNAVDGTRKLYDVDAVCVNHGFLPQSELARALGCTFRYERTTVSLSAERGEDGRTNVDGVFIVGDAARMRGARVAIAQGALAGAAVAAELGAKATPAAQLAQWRSDLRRHSRFQDALWQLYAAPPLTTQLAAAATLVCRCEEVERATVERSLGDCAPNFGALKRATRLGMGRCQGRYCAVLSAELMTQRFGSPPSAADFFAPRAPFKPVPVSELAGASGATVEAVDILRTTGRDANTWS